MNWIFKNGSQKHFQGKTNEIGLHADIFNKILYASQNEKNPEIKVFSAIMADIDKILNVKPKIRLKTIIPEQYWNYLNFVG